MSRKGSNRQRQYYGYLAVLVLVGLVVGCGSGSHTEAVTLSNPADAGMERVSRESKLQFPIYSPLPKVISGRTDTFLRLRSAPVSPYQPPMLYEFPLNYGCYFLPYEVE